MTTEAAHTLYRMFDADGRLLYVGITLDVGERFAMHRQGKSWWPAVAVIRLEHFATREDLEAAEAAVIAAEQPAYNVQREFRSSATRESTRRQKRLPESLRFTYEVVRRYAHRGPDDPVLQRHVQLARDCGISDDDIEWALANPWQTTLAAQIRDGKAAANRPSKES